MSIKLHQFSCNFCIIFVQQKVFSYCSPERFSMVVKKPLVQFSFHSLFLERKLIFNLVKMKRVEKSLNKLFNRFCILKIWLNLHSVRAKSTHSPHSFQSSFHLKAIRARDKWWNFIARAIRRVKQKVFFRFYFSSKTFLIWGRKKGKISIMF